VTARVQPHALNPSPASAHVLICYKNFAANKGLSHIGLGVAALNTSRTLRSLGYRADVAAVKSAVDIEDLIKATDAAALARGEHPVSHVVISAPWIPTHELQGLLMRHPDVHFVVVSHSNVGFLMADPNGIKLLRDGMGLSLAHHNFIVAGNSEKFVRAWTAMYGRGMQWLPNLYDCSTIKTVGQRPPYHPGAPLRVGVFGATRPLKNMVTSVAACVELASELRADVEVWMNTGRDEGGGTVRNAVNQLVIGLPTVRIVESGWQTWPSFRSVVAKMNALISPSYTESFNMVTADGAAEGVASVVSEAIDWAPKDWVANSDDVGDVARVVRRLIVDPHAVTEGQTALRTYVSAGSKEWRAYLGGES
jgi:hypothetical protein